MRGAGRVVFAATLLLLVGTVNIIYGFGALDDTGGSNCHACPPRCGPHTGHQRSPSFRPPPDDGILIRCRTTEFYVAMPGRV